MPFHSPVEPVAGFEPARPGSLDKEAFADLVTFRDFLDDRDQVMTGLYGAKLPRSSVRDTLVRAILIEFGSGRVRHVAFYQRGLAYLGTSSAVRTEIALLHRLGLVVLAAQGTDGRVTTVVPAQRLVDWYSATMPKLYDEIRRFLALRASSSPRGE